MKILIFGANGRTGKKVVSALGADKTVSFSGDVLDMSAVNSAIAGVDVVVSVIGHVKGSDPRVQTKGMQNIVSAMRKHKVNRLISLTGSGVRFTGDKISLIDRLLNFSILFIDKQRVLDGIEHAQVIKNSELDWTILRVLKLTNGAATNDWQMSVHGPAKTYISRSNVALAIKQLIDESSFIAQAPIIANN